MQTIPLYKYVREDGGVTISTTKPETQYEEMFRLVASEGMILSKSGEEPSFCVDVLSVDGWTEKPYVNLEDMTEEELLDTLEGLLND